MIGGRGIENEEKKMVSTVCWFMDDLCYWMPSSRMVCDVHIRVVGVNDNRKAQRRVCVEY